MDIGTVRLKAVGEDAGHGPVGILVVAIDETRPGLAARLDDERVADPVARMCAWLVLISTFGAAIFGVAGVLAAGVAIGRRRASRRPAVFGAADGVFVGAAAADRLLLLSRAAAISR